MRRWFAKFRSGDFGLKDEEDRGRKPSTENDQLRISVESNPQTTVRKLSEKLNVSVRKINKLFSLFGFIICK